MASVSSVGPRNVPDAFSLLVAQRRRHRLKIGGRHKERAAGEERVYQVRPETQNWDTSSCACNLSSAPVSAPWPTQQTKLAMEAFKTAKLGKAAQAAQAALAAGALDPRLWLVLLHCAFRKHQYDRVFQLVRARRGRGGGGGGGSTATATVGGDSRARPAVLLLAAAARCRISELGLR